MQKLQNHRNDVKNSQEKYKQALKQQVITMHRLYDLMQKLESDKKKKSEEDDTTSEEEGTSSDSEDEQYNANGKMEGKPPKDPSSFMQDET